MGSRVLKAALHPVQQDGHKAARAERGRAVLVYPVASGLTPRRSTFGGAGEEVIIRFLCGCANRAAFQFKMIVPVGNAACWGYAVKVLHQRWALVVVGPDQYVYDIPVDLADGAIAPFKSVL